MIYLKAWLRKAETRRADRQIYIYAKNNKNTLYSNRHARSRLLVRTYEDRSARLISSSFSRAFYSTFISRSFTRRHRSHSFDIHVIYVYIQFFDVYIVVCRAIVSQPIQQVSWLCKFTTMHLPGKINQSDITPIFFDVI